MKRLKKSKKLLACIALAATGVSVIVGVLLRKHNAVRYF